MVRLVEVISRVIEVVEMIRVVEEVKVIREVEVIRMVEVVHRNEENLGVKGPNKKNNVGLRMTMPQAAGKK